MIWDDDVLAFLKAQPDGQADLIVADPPYGIEKDYGVENVWADIQEWAVWCEVWLSECKRALKDTGNLIVYGIHNYLCYNQVSLYKIGMQYRRQFIWHYENGFCGNKSLPRATYEPFLWFSKSKQFYFQEIREPYKSQDRLKYKVVKQGKVWQPNPLGRIAGDVWNIPTLAGRRFRDEKVDHPSQKPLLLSERLIGHFSPIGGKVLVPFVGSGSECVAAFRLGREFAGTEINSKFRAIARGRLRAEGWAETNTPPVSYEMF
jgi:site-specific DNA-methyltransferase (adenine-specific)